jgi:hypothetical protein
MRWEDAVRGREAEARAAGLSLVGVRFVDFGARERRGQILVARELEREVREVFAAVLEARFPLQSVVPVAAFGWSDDASMEANNSSGFNPRPMVGGTRPSHHSTGRAVDLNPALNPFIKGSLVLPPGAVYDPTRPGTLTPDSAPVLAFESRGWTWGGRWDSRPDYHHFEKPEKPQPA